MKKVIGFISLMFLGSFGSLVSLVHADLFDMQKGREVEVYFSSASAFLGSTTYMLIDLSDTTNWPHVQKSGFHITGIDYQIDKAAASTTTVRIGVVNFVNASTGSISWFSSYKGDLNASNTNVAPFKDYNDLGIYTKVKAASNPDADGSTPFFVTNDKTQGSSAFKLFTNIPTILGGSAVPAVGDIVIEINKPATATNINYNIRVKYYSE